MLQKLDLNLPKSEFNKQQISPKGPKSRCPLLNLFVSLSIQQTTRFVSMQHLLGQEYFTACHRKLA